MELVIKVYKKFTLKLLINLIYNKKMKKLIYNKKIFKFIKKKN